MHRGFTVHLEIYSCQLSEYPVHRYSFDNTMGLYRRIRLPTLSTYAVIQVMLKLKLLL